MPCPSLRLRRTAFSSFFFNVSLVSSSLNSVSYRSLSGVLLPPLTHSLSCHCFFSLFQVRHATRPECVDMLGTVDRIDYDGDRVLKVVLCFPSRPGLDGDVVKEVSTCERIGHGSFGTVYRAIADGYPRLALKISTGKATRLRQELEVLSRVCTKGKLLLPRFEFGALNKTADLIVIGMELCVPCTLHDLLLSTRLTSEADMLFMGYQVAQAVDAVHSENCIHRDIKLQNLVFDLDGNLKLIDFGLSCPSLKPPPGDVVAGTVSFMAPEMAHNALHKDKRVSVGAAADVWSLGIVLFSIFTQRNPYPSLESTTATGSTSRPATGAFSTAGDEEDEEEEEVEGKASGPDHVAKRTASKQRSLNEQLLRRVAAGEWRWPVGCAVSEDLKRLVSAILVKNPDDRPTVRDVLRNKLWNLRRRCPPTAVTAFLGTQDDFFVSHDEAQLMRAVEQRSAGVNASLLNSSRVHSPDASGATNGSTATDGSGNARHGAEGGTHGGDSPTRAAGSLKVVEKPEYEVDGVPALQVYDVRASARKTSKPIRDISQVIADENAKRKGDATRSRSRRRATDGAEKSRGVAKSAPNSRASSVAGHLGGSGNGQQSEGRGRNGGRNAASQPAPAGVEEDLDALLSSIPTKASAAEGEGSDSTPGSSHSGDVSAANAHEDEEEGGSVTPTASAVTVSTTATSGVAGGKSVLDTSQVTATNEEEAEQTKTTTVVDSSSDGDDGAVACLDKSFSLVDDSEMDEESTHQRRGVRSRLRSARTASGASRPQGEGASQPRGRCAPTGSRTRGPRDPSLRESSTSILGGGTTLATATTSNATAAVAVRAGPPRKTSVKRTARAVTPRTSPALSTRADSPAKQAVVVSGASSTPLAAPPVVLEVEKRVTTAATVTKQKPNPLLPVSRRVQTWNSSVNGSDSGSHVAGGAGFTSPAKAKHLQKPLQDDGEASVAAKRALITQEEEEAAERALLAGSMLIQHEWLLSSFRLVIEEDQERYNMTWLAAEQAKSASHPHKFKEVMRVTSSKYKYGFVCDMCDYDYLPVGTKLHYFHCTCGRDLCPECYDEYRKQCTCSCCRKVHANRMALDEHLQQQRGHAAVSGTKRPRAQTSPVKLIRKGSAVSQASSANASAGTTTTLRRRGRNAAEDSSDTADEDDGVDVEEEENTAPKGGARAGKGSSRMSIAAMYQKSEQPSKPSGQSREAHDGGRIVVKKAIEKVPDGPWRPFARLRTERHEAAPQLPTPEERAALLNGEWIRHFYLFPTSENGEEPYAFVYHAQPGRTGAIFLTNEFPMHSAVFAMLERQFFVVDHVSIAEGEDTTRATTLLRAKGHPELGIAYQALQEIVAYDANMLKQRRAPGTVSVCQAPRSAYSCHGDPFLYVRWFRFNEDRTLSAFLLSNGAVQVFVNNEYELRWFEEHRKFLVRCNGVCEMVNDSTFTLAPAINHLLYDAFDT